MALTTGSGTFTNGSVTVSGVTFSSGGASFISSGTLLGVGVSPMDRQVEAVSATTNTITLREPWAGTTGAKEFTAAYTTEGLRDAVESARGFSEQLASRSTATTTDMQNATDDVKISTPLKVKQAIDFHAYNKAAADAEFVSRSDIVGTVSQSGGVPTGALMEYGSNANGEFWKYADGKMVCSFISEQNSFPPGESINFNILYPVTFIDSSGVRACPLVGSGATGGLFCSTASLASSINVGVYNVTGASVTKLILGTAIGRWY